MQRIGRLIVIALVAFALAGAGCLRRVLRVDSLPPGATVFVNGTELGRSPTQWPFTFYGTADVEIRHKEVRDDRVVAYRAEHLRKPLRIPWYEYFPLDLFTELLVPVPITDVHGLRVELTEYPDASRGIEDDLLTEAERIALERRVDRMRADLGRPPGPPSAR